MTDINPASEHVGSMIQGLDELTVMALRAGANLGMLTERIVDGEVDVGADDAQRLAQAAVNLAMVLRGTGLDLYQNRVEILEASARETTKPQTEPDHPVWTYLLDGPASLTAIAEGVGYEPGDLGGWLDTATILRDLMGQGRVSYDPDTLAYDMVVDRATTEAGFLEACEFSTALTEKINVMIGDKPNSLLGVSFVVKQVARELGITEGQALDVVSNLVKAEMLRSRSGSASSKSALLARAEPEK